MRLKINEIFDSHLNSNNKKKACSKNHTYLTKNNIYKLLDIFLQQNVNKPLSTKNFYSKV